jgi:hypothetical protein
MHQIVSVASIKLGIGGRHMNSKDYSRREFLMTFAVLSTAPLLANMLSGCGIGGGGDGPGPVSYGPAPNPEVIVNGIVFLDAQSNQVNLSGNQTVPVHTSFIIQFSGLINVASVPAATTFIDSNNNPVAFTTSSGQSAQYSISVTITPTADLLPNSNYTLSIGDTATDSYGDKLIVDANASAAFKTMS